MEFSKKNYVQYVERRELRDTMKTILNRLWWFGYVKNTTYKLMAED